MIELAKWDTEHFNLKVGVLILDGIPSYEVLNNELSIAKQEGYDVLYLKGVDLPETLLGENILLADQKIVYSQTIKECFLCEDEHIQSILYKELDTDLLSLALQSGEYSRYFTDKKFPLHVFLDLYGTWIKDSLNGTLATDVIAYVNNSCVQGFITYKQNENFVNVGLVVVDRTLKGNGIGSKLMKHFLSKFPIGTKIEVATQLSNKPACHFYEKNGFTIKSVTNIYHIWL